MYQDVIIYRGSGGILILKKSASFMLFINFWFYFVSCRDRFKFLFLPYSDSRANLERYAGVCSDSDVFAAKIAKKIQFRS